MEFCRDCRYHREVELREKEKEKVQFNEFVGKVKAEQSRKKIRCDYMIFFLRSLSDIFLAL